jgi:protein ImuB
MDRLYGDAGQLANKLRRSVMAAGFLANIAVAGNFHAAVSLACGRTGVSVVPSGCEALAIGQLPVTALHLAPEHEATFAVSLHVSGRLERSCIRSRVARGLT